MAWSKLFIFALIANVDYTLGSHGHHHEHLNVAPHAENLEARDLAWADRIPADMVIEFRTLTTTVYEDCMPTNTIFVTTTVFEDVMLGPTHSHLKLTQPTLNNPQPTEPEPTTTVLMTKTVLDIVTDIPSITVTNSVPENEGLIFKNPIDVTAPPRVVLSQETDTGIHTSTKITASIPGHGNATVSVAIDVTETEPAREVDLDKKPIPEPTPTDPAPGILPTLPNLPQILPATAIPNLSDIGHALDPNGQPLPSDIQWTALPKDGKFSTKRFGGRSAPQGTKIKYRGNVGIPWGSNIIAVGPTEAHRYKYVVQFQGSNTDPWTVIVWNKVGPDGKMDGWYGHSALTFVLAPGETKYVAFDEDSEGAWGAAPGTNGLPTDHWGGYTSTWGEFTFGDIENSGWSGWDVSAIQAQIAHGNVQGMRICQADGKGCSILTPRAEKVIAAYTESKKHRDGIGGAAAPGPVRLVVDIDYKG
ncbi:hypothetical protein N7456_005141 [Penicillium angulare]|uniref:Allergen Asp f 4 n=1 Tax=Penicillium angulare TaxID=116970 RepID=A0A9W9KJV9_9EURO|nr:hypothetical protein N7456_005141 [Penicillium angulare]